MNLKVFVAELLGCFVAVLFAPAIAKLDTKRNTTEPRCQQGILLGFTKKVIN